MMQLDPPEIEVWQVVPLPSSNSPETAMDETGMSLDLVFVSETETGELVAPTSVTGKVSGELGSKLSAPVLSIDATE
jgi:hypothetical protein